MKNIKRMEWINIIRNREDEIPTDKTIIVEDCNGWIGQAYLNEGRWVLEIFDQTMKNIEFSTIVRYLII